jgi:protein-disulfide isomerase
MKKLAVILGIALVFGGIRIPVIHAKGPMQEKEEQIKSLKEQIASLQEQIDEMSESKDRSALTDSEQLNLLKVRETDHTRGDPNAPVVLVVYSDFESPFHKIFHDTLLKVYKKYGEQGDVLWVHRNFPLGTLFPNGMRIAGASECVAHLSGNEAYWKFIDKLSAGRKTSGPTDVKPIDMTKMARYAKSVGVDSKKFKTCFTKNTYKDSLTDSFKEGVKLGVKGVPMTAVIVHGGVGGVEWISGAQPYETVESIIKTSLIKSSR